MRPLVRSGPNGSPWSVLGELCSVAFVAPAFDPDALSPGFVLGGFSIEALLGRGAYGSVYRARRAGDGVAVALKVMHSRVLTHTGGAERFAREAELARRLDHPNVVRVVGAGEEGSLLFTALELLEGESIEDRIARGPTPPQEVAFIADGALAGLEAAHVAGILHRDIKPANLFLCAPEGVKILDFGVAKSTNPNTAAGLTRDGLALGTPAYMAPEHLAGVGLGPACDLFGLGLVLAEMLLGRSLYSAETSALDVLRERLSGARPPIPAELLSSPLGAVIEAATRPDPATRTASAGAMRRALAAAAAQLAPAPRDRPRTGVIVRPKPIYATLDTRLSPPGSSAHASQAVAPRGLTPTPHASALAGSVGVARPGAPPGQEPAVPALHAASAPSPTGRRGLLLVGLGGIALLGLGGAALWFGTRRTAPARSAESDESEADEAPSSAKTAKKRVASASVSASSQPTSAPSSAGSASAAGPDANGPFAPMPLAVGQWFRIRITNDGKVSHSTYRLVGREPDGMWILEVDNESSGGPMTIELILDFGDRMHVDTVRLRSARVKLRGTITVLPASGSQALLREIAPTLVLPELDPKKRVDVTVPAGTFKACYTGFSKAKVMGQSLEQTTFLHPSVPINGLVKGEGTLNGKPSLTELVELGLEGAKRSM